MTVDDARIWKIVKTLPWTQSQWERLHDLIERERRMLIEDYRHSRQAGGPAPRVSPAQEPEK